MIRTGTHLPWAAALALCGGILAQGRATAWQELRSRIDDPSMTRAAKLAALRRFVVEHGRTEAEQQTGEVLAARLELAALHLAAFEPERAGAEFDTVVDRAPRDAVDLRGHALYGAALAAELAGDSTRCRGLYERVAREFGGTRYADDAKVALHRLDRPEAERTRVGKPLPEFGPVLDRGGASHRLAEHRGRPVLLLFVDPSDDAATGAIRALVATARAAGMPDGTVIAFVTTSDDAALAAFVERTRLRMPIVPGTDRFLSPAFLRYEVRAVPSSLLVGPDGTLLGRDLPARRLREILEQLRG